LSFDVTVVYERIHLTLKKEATKPASFNFLQQQSRFDGFVELYNNVRPHEASGMRYPGELYTPSARTYRVPDEPEDPFHDRAVRMAQCGRLCIGRRKINLSLVFAGQTWLVSFMDFDFGFFDQDEGRVEPAQNPFLAKMLPKRSRAGSRS